MGLARTRHTVMRNGEFSQASGATYYQGSPAGVDTSGTLNIITTTTHDSGAKSYVGVFRNTSAYDALQQDDKAAIFMGPAILTFQYNIANTNNSSINNDGAPGNQTGDAYPYDSTLTWNEADRLYLTTTGLWSNVVAVAGDPIYGTVLKVGTNYLTVFMYGSPSSY